MDLDLIFSIHNVIFYSIISVYSIYLIRFLKFNVDIYSEVYQHIRRDQLICVLIFVSTALKLPLFYMSAIEDKLNEAVLTCYICASCTLFGSVLLVCKQWLKITRVEAEIINFSVFISYIVLLTSTVVTALVITSGVPTSTADIGDSTNYSMVLGFLAGSDLLRFSFTVIGLTTRSLPLLSLLSLCLSRTDDVTSVASSGVYDSTVTQTLPRVL